MLKIENLSKNYGSFKAVDNLSLNIKEGTIFGFIGHNGAGKTTTLKCIAGILPIDEGEIYINGKSIKKQAFECKKDIAYIMDNPDLYSYLKGIEYLNFICDVYKVGNERKELIKHYADLFELDALNDLIGSYSHGMKQKLAIISAFIHKPKLIIMDEPFVGLDPKASHILKEEMRKHCDAGGAIFFSTHVLEVAQKLCDEVAIIKAGKLIVTGKMEEITKDASLENVFLELEGEK